jgi:Cu(I)/Ag(I) efflux system membrane fusion protein
MVLVAVIVLVAFRHPILAWFTGETMPGTAARSAPAGAPPAAAPGTPPAEPSTAAPAGGTPASGQPQAAPPAGAIAFYTCSMHPSVHQDHPGKCPVCSMDLVPVRRSEAGSGTVVLDDGRRQEIGIRTGVVERRPAAERVRALGKVAFDESHLADVTVKVAGYVGSLTVSQVGQRVERGQALFTFYSPEIYVAEQEYLAALASQKAARASSVPDRADYLVAAAAQKLRLWDVTEDEINRLNERGEPDKEVPMLSPAAGVVLERDVVQGAAVTPGMKLFRIADLAHLRVDAEVYQADLPRVRLGQRAAVRFASLPGRALGGRVSQISPALDPASRTAQVRIELDPHRAPGSTLRPDMVAEVELAAPGGQVLVVPDGAVLFTGTRALVFVDEGGGRFRPREVQLGARAGGGGAYVVVSGLAAGDRVVTSGQFLLDAEGRLQGAPAPASAPARRQP